MESESIKPISAPVAVSPIMTSSSPVQAPRRKRLVILSLVLGALFLVVSSFSLGFSAGIHKARFSYRFGENYERNFMQSEKKEMKEKMLHKMDGKLFRSGHGVAGEILSISGRAIAVRSPEGQENSIVVTDSTIYNKGGDQVSLEGLSAGDRIVVLGKPSDDGTVIADLIRAFDSKIDQKTGGLLQKLFR